MRPRYILDANVLVRFLANEKTDHFTRSKRLMELAERGECELSLVPWILAEVIFATISLYETDKQQTVGLLRRVIDAGGIVVQDKAMAIDALSRFAAKNVDFADALLAAQCVAMGLRPASFDRDLDKFPDVHRFEP